MEKIARPPDPITIRAKKEVKLPDRKELLLRCDCGTEIMALDVWLSQGVDAKDVPVENDKWFQVEESYLTFYNDSNPAKGFIKRIKATWKVLRGDPYTFSCVILKPEDVIKLADFLSDFTSTKPGGGENK